MKEGKIFISYSWKDSQTADQIEILFHNKKTHLNRDIRDIEYRDSIKEFMKKVRTARYCLMLLSDAYLKSKNCMYEVLEFIKDENYREKILPVLISDLKIFSAADRAKYIEYWEREYAKLEESRASIKTLNQVDIIQDLKMLENIARGIAEFLGIVADMKMVRVEKDVSLGEFNKIFAIVSPGSVEKEFSDKLGGYFIANLPQSISDKVFTWWKVESRGYTQDLREAKVFTQDEVIEMFISSEYNSWDNKKFVAIPVEVVIEFGQNIVPYMYRFREIVLRNSAKSYGNHRLSLTKEEVEEYY